MRQALMHAGIGLLVLLGSACSSGGETPTPTPTPTLTPTPKPLTGDCKSNNGVCTSDANTCGASGGAVYEGGASSCVFDDGAGVCCIPPAAQPTGDSCQALGGTCAPISGCGMLDGWYAPASNCGSWVGEICCVPASTCTVSEPMACCKEGDTAYYVASCDRGTLVCEVEGTQVQTEAYCKALVGARR